jgi:hypothetical protein
LVRREGHHRSVSGLGSRDGRRTVDKRIIDLDRKPPVEPKTTKRSTVDERGPN